LVDSALIWLVLVKWLHVVSASVWLGGLITTTIIFRGARSAFEPQAASEFMGMVGRVIATPMRVSLYIAMATGVINAMNRGFGFNDLLHLPQAGLPGWALLLKLALAPTVLLLAIYHTRVGRLLSRAPSPPHRQLLRRRMIVAGRLALLLTVVLTVLGSLLRFT